MIKKEIICPDCNGHGWLIIRGIRKEEWLDCKKCKGVGYLGCNQKKQIKHPENKIFLELVKEERTFLLKIMGIKIHRGV